MYWFCQYLRNAVIIAQLILVLYCKIKIVANYSLIATGSLEKF